MGIVETGRVTGQRKIAPDLWQLRLALPQIAATIRPGQFIHLRRAGMSGLLLRRPFSPSRVDAAAGIVEMVYRVVGRGTREMTHWTDGTPVDVLGPLGTTFTLDGRLLMVGGGVGIAPLMYASQECAPGSVTALIGGRNRAEMVWAELFPAGVTDIRIATDDGSLGYHGYVPELVPALLAEGGYTRVLTCGPPVMMHAVVRMAEAAGVACEVSLERRMGCGTGGCLACVCDRRGGGHAKVCLDGPVFDSREVRL